MSPDLLSILGWAIIITVAIVYELATALDDFLNAKDGSKTWPLTWVYRRMMCHRIPRTIVWAFFGWMIWHWGIQLFGPWAGNGWVDIAFTAAGALFGWFIGPPKRMVKCPD